MNRFDDRGSPGAGTGETGYGMSPERLSGVEPGWDVYGSDDEQIGSVHDVGADFLEVEKGVFFIKDLYIPESAVGSVDSDTHRVLLNVTKDAVGDMGWTQPPATGLGSDGAAGSRQVRETWGQGSLDDAAAAGPRSSGYEPRGLERGGAAERAPATEPAGTAGAALAAAGAADRFQMERPDRAEPRGEGTDPVWKPAPAEDEAPPAEPLAGGAEAFDGVAAAGYTAGTGIPPVAPRSVDADPGAGDSDAALQERSDEGPDASDGGVRPRGW